MMWAIGEKDGVSVLRSKSRQACFILLMGIFVRFSLLLAYDWPIREDTVQHVITATLGEWRNGHFHAGVDINAPCGTGVYAIEGDTCYIDRVNSYGSGINIGHFRYFHSRLRLSRKSFNFIVQLFLMKGWLPWRRRFTRC